MAAENKRSEGLRSPPGAGLGGLGDLPGRSRTARPPRLALLAALVAATGLAAAGDRQGRAPFPADFLADGSGRIGLEAGGRQIPLAIAAAPGWSGEGVHEVAAESGVTIRFRKLPEDQGGGRVVSVLHLARRSDPPLAVTIEAKVTSFGAALPVRFGPRGSRDVVLLGIDGGGAEVATGLADPAAGRGVDFGWISERLSLAIVPGSGSEWTVAVEGPIPRGRETVVFASRPVNLGSPGTGTRGAPRGDIEGRAAALTGWSLSGSDAAKEAAGLAKRIPFLPGLHVEVRDGWQGKGGSKGSARPPRSWLPAPSVEGDPKGARRPALADVLAQLRALGYRPGLWILPHGQDDESAFRRSPEAFVRGEKGEAVPGGSFLGRFIVDGTRQEGLVYLRDLFRTLRGLGADIFRIGGLRETLQFYSDERETLAGPGLEPIEVLRRTIAAIRDGAGEGAVLCGDVGTPPEVADLLDAVRPPRLEDEGVEPLRLEAAAAARTYHRHRVEGWVECLPVEEWPGEVSSPRHRASSESRTTFAALTGRGLVVGGRHGLPQRPAEVAWALDLLQASWPPARVRPVDLFAAEGLPRVWDLKTADAALDVVGIFNWSDLESTSVPIAPGDLGPRTRSGARVIYFDLRTETFAGARRGPSDFFLLPGRSRFLSVQPDLGRPQVVGVSRHLLATAAWLESAQWNAERMELKGVVAVPGPGVEPVGLRLHIACGENDGVAGASAGGAQVQFTTSPGHVVLSIAAQGGARTAFSVTFADGGPAPAEAKAAPPVRDLRVTYEETERRPLLRWGPGAPGLEWWRSVSGFAVLRDGAEVGRTTDTVFLDEGAVRGVEHRYAIAALPGGTACAPVSFAFPGARDELLDEWSLAAWSQGRGLPARGRSVVGGPLTVGGKKSEHGFGTRVPSRLDFRLDGAHAHFEAEVGVDDAALFQGSVDFVVLVDGVERHRTGPIRGGTAAPRKISVPIVGGKLLSLVAEDAGDGAEGDMADWMNARVVVK